MRNVMLAAMLVALAVTPALAQERPTVEHVPRQPPSLPAGLIVSCLQSPEYMRQAERCPVIRYQGMTTWMFSYQDNRMSMALVTYGPGNRIVRNVEHKGARHVANVVPSPRTQTVLISGYFDQYQHRTITVPWSELGR